ncbi:class I SAM-dependent methyltransferase [Desulfosporosinus meridiei]|uniref:Methylase involved in ubiquinone/menaquinone biosynthesis n=1 Tax=Desulfosporosinus meridiei (strain ATCC BAA-275 / DSM 13257 / KCTC 12902 / NCIMB 13706 / S10) TaxID=768704 RepID=J7IV05_DESMD|nr:class I SAM-dependent methyltransferase [Desulfosporosinus meridiei]AFQ42536.1 methylase involved in ubiquinone/menaquinone biosynthesis [Desulfosporosinus meridiei DSM 13257]
MLEHGIEGYWDRQETGKSKSVQDDRACPKKEAWKSLLIKYVGRGENQQVLDVGTGDGFLAILLAGLDYSVTAIYGHSDRLEQAQKNAQASGKNIRFLKAEAHAIDLPNESVDLIVARNALGLSLHPQEVYQEWFRLLKPYGKVLVFDANWYLRLNNPDLQRQCNKYRHLAIKKGYQDNSIFEQQVSEAIARGMPLSYERRPLWDHGAFRRCGFQQIEVEENISPWVFSELEQILYYPTPMFAICATK